MEHEELKKQLYFSNITSLTAPGIFPNSAEPDLFLAKYKFVAVLILNVYAYI